MRRYVKSEHCTSLSLTSLVPCAGTALQGEGQCQLLEHARSALSIIPQHKQSLRRLEHAQRQQTEGLSQLNAQITALFDALQHLTEDDPYFLSRNRDDRTAAGSIIFPPKERIKSAIASADNIPDSWKAYLSSVGTGHH